MKGIDISNNNGRVDFGKVKKSGIEVIIMKATEGVNWKDNYLNEFYNEANRYGFNIGFYHFMSETSLPKEQARDFWNAIKGFKFNVLPCLDIETNRLGRNRKQISDRCIEFLEEFKKLSGLRCMVYTGGYFGKDNLDERVKKYPGWIAHYGVNKPMENGFKVIGHQYTEDGKVNGVNGRVDMNNFTSEIFINKNSQPKPQPSKPSSLKGFKQHGTCTVIVDKLNIRSGAGLKYSIEGSFKRGDKVIYDYVIDNDGYRWIRWIGATSGKYRYAAVRDLKTNKKLGNCV